MSSFFSFTRDLFNTEYTFITYFPRRPLVLVNEFSTPVSDNASLNVSFTSPDSKSGDIGAFTLPLQSNSKITLNSLAGMICWNFVLIDENTV